MQLIDADPELRCILCARAARLPTLLRAWFRAEREDRRERRAISRKCCCMHEMFVDGHGMSHRKKPPVS